MMTATEEQAMEELMKPFFRLATTAMFLLTRMLPPNYHLTLIARHDEVKTPIVVSEDDIHKVEASLAAIIRDAKTGEARMFFGADFKPAGMPN